MGPTNAASVDPRVNSTSTARQGNAAQPGREQGNGATAASSIDPAGPGEQSGAGGDNAGEGDGQWPAMRLPSLESAPYLWRPPEFSWDVAKGLFDESVIPVVTRQPDADTSFNESAYPDHSLALEVTALDATTGEYVWDFEAEVVDDLGAALVRATITGRHRFLLSFDGTRKFVIRVVKGDKLGLSVLTINSNMSLYGDGHTVYGPDVHGANKWSAQVEVVLANDTRRTAGHAVHVRDADGGPLAGTIGYMCSNNVLGQTDHNGRMLFPVWHDRIWSGSITIVHPGYVPVFLDAADLKPGMSTTVVLRAEEYVVEFYLMQPPERIHSLRHWDCNRAVFAPDEEPRRALATSEWGGWVIERLGYYAREGARAVLAEVIGYPVSPAIGELYDRWYSRQWSYDELTGMWRIVIPHTGRFLIALDLKILPGKTIYNIHPGMLIDATDPDNPTVELVFPE